MENRKYHQILLGVFLVLIWFALHNLQNSHVHKSLNSNNVSLFGERVATAIESNDFSSVPGLAKISRDQKDDLKIFFDNWVKNYPTTELKRSYIRANNIVNSLGTTQETTHYLELERVYLEGVTLYKFFIEVDNSGQTFLSQIDMFHRTGHVSLIRELLPRTISLKGFCVLSIIFLLCWFISYTIIVCVNQKDTRMKLFWITFIAIGAYGFKFNTETGSLWLSFITRNPNGNGTSDLVFNFFAFSFLGVSFDREYLIDPWIMSLDIPFGATLFWVYLAYKKTN